MKTTEKDLRTTLIDEIKRYGNDITVRDQLTRELTSYKFIVDKFEFKITKKEEKYLEGKLEKYSEDLKHIINILKIDKFSRRATVIFDKHEYPPECIISISFMIRNDKLFCILNSRSLDVKKKLHSDILIAKKMSEKIEKELDVQLYSIKVYVNSLHIYLK